MLSDESDQDCDKSMTRMLARKRKNNMCETKSDKTSKKKDDGHVEKEEENGSQESKESFRHEIFTSAANAKRIAINYYGEAEDYMRSKGVDYMRFNRLEQNRKAARESRRRKKVMIEELQRSVIFFSRSNSLIKRQNDDLERILTSAKCAVCKITDAKNDKSEVKSEAKIPKESPKQDDDIIVKEEIVNVDEDRSEQITFDCGSNDEKLQDGDDSKPIDDKDCKSNERSQKINASNAHQMHAMYQHMFGIQQNNAQAAAAVQATMMGNMKGMTMPNAMVGMGGTLIPFNAFAPQVQQVQNPTVQFMNPGAMVAMGQNVAVGALPTVPMAYMAPFPSFPLVLPSTNSPVHKTKIKDES